jgi:hypothetical protein
MTNHLQAGHFDATKEQQKNHWQDERHFDGMSAARWLITLKDRHVQGSNIHSTVQD